MALGERIDDMSADSKGWPSLQVQSEAGVEEVSGDGSATPDDSL